MKQPITTLHHSNKTLTDIQYFKLFHEVFYLQIWIIQAPFFCGLSLVCLIIVVLFYNIEKHFSCSQTLKLWTTTSSWQTKQPRQCLGYTNYWLLVKCTWFLKHHWKFGLITLLPWDKIRNGAFQESMRNIG